MFRARFADFRGAAVRESHSVDCLAYKKVEAQAAGDGMAMVSMQSFVDATGHRQYQSVWAK
jgi:hypothetical protein